MSVPYRVPGELRLRLQHALAGGIAEEALLHALQVAEVMGVLHEAFEQAGFRVVLVGGGAIEIHAPASIARATSISGPIDLALRLREELERLKQNPQPPVRGG